jgi:hypothetical protein
MSKVVRLGERARKRHYDKTDKGHVVTFMVQLEVEVEDGVWKAVIRYDCANKIFLFSQELSLS